MKSSIGFRARRLGQIGALLAAGMLIVPVAMAQDATPNAAAEGDAIVRAMDPNNLPEEWKIPAKVTHVTNYGVHEWYQNLIKGEEARAAEYGIDFSQVDANLDLQASLAAVEEVAGQVDVINFTPVNEEASGPTITKIAKDTGKPIICESSPTEGCTTLVSIDDFAAGFKVGEWAGNYAKENFDGAARALDVGLPALTTTVARSEGFAAGLKSVLPDAQIVASVDGKGLKDEAVKVAGDALTANPDVNIIFGINDDSALGGLQAFESQGGDTAQLLVVGFGCEGNACKDALMEGGPYKVSAAMFPEYQGRLLIDAGVAAFNDVTLPAHIVAPTAAVTADNLGDYYTKGDEGYAANFDAIAKISVEGEK
ncbi:MAG: sugar ABC transporter substrate-binding protein [Thermomicrobiales bacterium]|nr:sugar ABC transporter substrate-binding protein [Thermomicrobiales bacterium]